MRNALLLIAVTAAGCSIPDPTTGANTYRCSCGPCVDNSASGTVLDPVYDYYPTAYVCADDLSEAASDCQYACPQIAGLEAGFRQPRCDYADVDDLFAAVSCIHSSESGSRTDPLLAYDSNLTWAGQVDPYRSWIEVTSTSTGEDYVVVPEGIAHLKGGDCPTQSCPFNITGFSLDSAPVSVDGAMVDIDVHTNGVMTGQKFADLTYVLPNNQLSLNIWGDYDGEPVGDEVQATSDVVGEFVDFEYLYGSFVLDPTSLPTPYMTMYGEYESSVYGIQVRAYLVLVFGHGSDDDFYHYPPRGIVSTAPDGSGNFLVDVDIDLFDPQDLFPDDVWVHLVRIDGGVFEAEEDAEVQGGYQTVIPDDGELRSFILEGANGKWVEVPICVDSEDERCGTPD